jgi:AAA15 family ATPase/GTPase
LKLAEQNRLLIRNGIINLSKNDKMGEIMIKEIFFKLIDRNNNSFTFYPKVVNIVVGSNNSGKSLFLRELDTVLKGQSLSNYGFIKNIVDEISVLKIEENLEKEIMKKNDGYNQESNYISFFEENSINPSFNISKEKYYSFINSTMDIIKTNNEEEYANFKRYTVGKTSLLLNGYTRLTSMQGTSWGLNNSVLDGGNKVIQSIMNNNELYNTWQNYIYDAFSCFPEIILDGGTAKVVFSENKLDENLRLSAKPEVKSFLEKANDEYNTSDGRKAYHGIISEIVAGKNDVIMIDEAEAFLHPPLARKLGRTISKMASSGNIQLFVTTHSSDFLMGCIEAKVPMNIIRLTYEGNIGQITQVDEELLSRMIRHPLLRSTNVLDGLFYKRVIVTESDTDRAFYQEINNRFLENKSKWHISDCLFLNAQNKQTVGVIVNALRKIGIPAASILDFDMIKEGGREFTSYLKSVGIPESLHKTISQNKTEIKQKFPKKLDGNYAKNSEMKTKGINYLAELSDGSINSGELFLDTLKKFGLFVVPGGEVETWLKDLNISGHGTKWLINIFEKMGDNSENNEYVTPSADDVWYFMKLINEWFINEKRGGMEEEYLNQF